MKNIENFNPIELQDFYFDEENIYTLDLEKILDIMEKKFYGFSFFLSLKKIEQQLEKIGFNYSNGMYIYINDYLVIQIELDFLIEESKYCILEIFFKSNIKEKTIIFKEGYLFSVIENISVEKDLTEKKSVYNYDKLIINNEKKIHLKSIIYYYEDYRDNEIHNLHLFSIIEIPFKIKTLETHFCIFDLIFINDTSKVHKMSDILEYGFNKLDVLFNIKSTDRFKFNKISSILNEEEMKILTIMKY